MSEIGKYIYGVMNSNKEGKSFSEGVYSVPYQDISAVVSDSEIVDYAYILKETLARQLVEHQRIIEGIMSQGLTVIPMKLGTFAQDEAEVRDILNKGYRIVKDIFEKVNERIEIDVCATWSDFNSVLRETGEEKELKEFKENFLADSKGITVEDRMKVGVMVKKLLDEKRENCAKQIQNVLKAVSQNFKKHEVMDDKMVINTAFLVNRSQRDDFYKKVEELDTEFNEGLNFRCVGPLPPYSFYTIEVKKMQFNEIDWARKKLRLNECASKDEIRKAFKSMAIFSHPDKNPDLPNKNEEFDDVTRAYKLLNEYCSACEQAGQENVCSFKKEELKKNTILVKVRD